MKKILFSTATAMFFFISCNDSATTGTGAATTDSSQANKNLASNRKVYKAIETGDAATLDSLIADDAVDHQGQNGVEIKSGDSIRHMLADMHNHVKNLNLNIIADAAKDDYIFAMSRLTGTAADSLMGMPAGSKIDMKGVDVIKVKDGKMVEHWGFIDPNEIMKQAKKMEEKK